MSDTAEKQRKALGKGLSALLPGRPFGQASTATAPAPMSASDAAPSTLPVEAIHPNPMQPRVVFQPERLQELAVSIRANGIIQPLIVRRHEGQFQLVAGERRLRAAKIAGLTEVPVVIQEVADPLLLELALIENIQREDLNAIEIARAYERLGRDLGLTQEDIGRRTGKDRASIANALRLLNLPVEVQLLLAENRLSMGHARAVLGLPTAEQQIAIAEKAAAQGLSVRRVERLVQNLTSDRTLTENAKTLDPNVRAAIEELERALGTRVRIVELSEQRGRIEIDYYSQTELDRLFQHIVGTVN